jgi:hypothetical protein
MRTLPVVVLSSALALAVSALLTSPSADGRASVNGRIVFSRFEPSLGDTATFTTASGGRHVHPLFARASGMAHWSPDATRIAIFCCDDGMIAHIVNPRTGAFRELPNPDPNLEMHCGFAWSPDGRRLACETFGVTDPALTGIYSVRSSDGRGLARITTNPGGDDIPGDYSPDGRRMVFLRLDANGPVGIFVTRVDGTRPRRITPPGMMLSEETGGSWSPTGHWIVFSARSSPTNRLAIWMVKASGADLHRVPISCGGALVDPTSSRCPDPGWSPDGSKIVFTRISNGGNVSNIYTATTNGRDLTRVTSGGADSQPDWGPRPAG